MLGVSAATAWELGLEVRLGKFRLPESVEDGIVAAGFTGTPVCEGLAFMTHDDQITRYEVAVLRVHPSARTASRPSDR